jgi:hypothetical protein
MCSPITPDAAKTVIANQVGARAWHLRLVTVYANQNVRQERSAMVDMTQVVRVENAVASLTAMYARIAAERFQIALIQILSQETRMFVFGTANVLLTGAKLEMQAVAEDARPSVRLARSATGKTIILALVVIAEVVTSVQIQTDVYPMANIATRTPIVNLIIVKEAVLIMAHVPLEHVDQSEMTSPNATIGKMTAVKVENAEAAISVPTPTANSPTVNTVTSMAARLIRIASLTGAKAAAPIMGHVMQDIVRPSLE